MQNDLKELVKALNEDGAVIVPTDTIYGFSCRIGSSVAQDKIRELKKRDNKPFLILDSNLARVRQYFKESPFTMRFIDLLVAEGLWPNNITLIATKDPGRDFPFLKGVATVAVRYTDHPLIREIADSIRDGILSTSINVSGEKELVEIGEIGKKYGEQVDFIWSSLPQDKGALRSSVIVMLNEEEGSFEIIREGEREIAVRIRALKERLSSDDV